MWFNSLLQVQHDEHSVYLPMVNLSSEHDSLRRSSLSGISSVGSAPRNSIPPEQRTPDFCTLRRGVRGPDIRGPDITLTHHLAGDDVSNSQPINGLPPNGVMHNRETFRTPYDAYGYEQEAARPEISHLVTSG